MRKLVVVLAVLANAVAVASEPAQSGAPGLDKVYTVEAGDIAATEIALFFASGIVKQSFDAPVLAQYDRGAKKLQIMIFGSRSNVEGARKTMDEFQAILKSIASGMLESRRGIQLTDANTTIVYMTRTGYGDSAQLKEVLRREGGKFITP